MNEDKADGSEWPPEEAPTPIPDLVAVRGDAQLRKALARITYKPLSGTPYEAPSWHLEAREAVDKAAGSLIDSLSGGSLPSYFFQIQKDVELRVEPNTYPSLHVEQMLDHAANLLDRGLSLRNEWDSLSAKALEYTIDLIEKVQIDRVDRVAEDKNIYEIEYASELCIRDVEKLRARGLSLQISALKSEVDILEGSRKSIVYTAKIAGYMGSLGALKSEGDNGWRSATWGEYLPDGFTGKSLRVSVFSGQAASILKGFDYDITLRDNIRASSALTLEQSVAEFKVKVGTDISERKLIAAGLERQRAGTRRSSLEARLRSVVDSDGVLNYSKRLNGLQARFARDLEDAATRVMSIKDSIRELYGYRPPLPDTASNEFFDDLLIWCRNAIQHVVAFSEHDQGAAIVISLRRHLGDSEFEKACDSGEISFVLDPDDDEFADWRSVRIRGVAASVRIDGGASDRWWQMTLTAPRVGEVRSIDGSTAAIENFMDDRDCIVRLTDAREYLSPRSPTIYGSSILHNVSPFGGTWDIKGITSVERGQSATALQDIILELHCVFQQRRRR